MFNTSGIITEDLPPAEFKSVIVSSSDSNLSTYTFSIITTLSTEADKAIGVFYSGGFNGTMPTPLSLKLNGQVLSGGYDANQVSKSTFEGLLGFSWWLNSRVPSTAGSYDVELVWDSSVDWCAIALYEVYDVDQATPFTDIQSGSTLSYDLIGLDSGQVFLGGGVGITDGGTINANATQTPTGWTTDIDFEEVGDVGVFLSGHTLTGDAGDTVEISGSGAVNRIASYIRTNKA